ncbi:MAG: cupin domain-containing protein [Candidatus Aureabacteria bacterium]|nr:cupin domain-containing protein [Candidatus Auribacterota bacterium]
MARSVVKDLYEAMEFPMEGVFSKLLAKGDISNHTLMCLAKGTDITEHTSTREAVVTILKGKGLFILNGKKIRMKPGVFIFMPKNAPHALRADEDLAFLLSLSGKETR